MVVRGLGCPVRFTLTAGQKGDAPQAAALIEGLPAEVVIADTAYDADHLRKDIAAKKALAVIPNNPSRALKYPLDKHLYAQRHLVECCFSKLKQFRRVATRFEKTARNYQAVVTLMRARCVRGSGLNTCASLLNAPKPGRTIVLECNGRDCTNSMMRCGTGWRITAP